MIGIADKLRALDIIRWNMVPLQRQQSLAEHTFMVAMVAEHIANELGITTGAVIRLALYHDLEEVMTGDIPAPTKRALENTGVNFGAVFNKLGFIDLTAPPNASTIVKAADYIADIIYLRRYGNMPYAVLVMDRLSKNFWDYLETVPDQVKDAALKTFALCGNDQMELP